MVDTLTSYNFNSKSKVKSSTTNKEQLF